MCLLKHVQRVDVTDDDIVYVLTALQHNCKKTHTQLK